MPPSDVLLAPPPSTQGRPPLLLEVAHQILCRRHLSPRTRKAYLGWMRRFLRFYRGRHPRAMGSEEVRAYLSHLAVGHHVSASTQNQALAALLFLYRNVLGLGL